MKTSELYDLLQELFGIGDYDDDLSPWYQTRAVEIGKLTAMLKARHCTADEVALAARYAVAQHIPITASWQVFKVVPEALQAQRHTGTVDKAAALRDARAASIREALALHDRAWAERLMRTPDAHLDTALGEWRKHVNALRP